MSIADVRERLAEMAANIPGIRRAYARAPRTLQPAHLPCCLVFPSSANYTVRALGAKMREERRIYALRTYVGELLDGTEFEVEKKAETFIQRITDYFAARPGLELETMAHPRGLVYDASVIGDRGISVQSYLGDEVLYVVVEHTIQVRERILVTHKE